MGYTIYCGKRVIITVNGVTSSTPFFIGDGYERCARSSDSMWNLSAVARLDFSFTALNTLLLLAYLNGHIDISFDIVNETLYYFDV